MREAVIVDSCRTALCKSFRGSFNMTYLALNFSSFVNGVSQLHGRVSQKLLHPFWPRSLESEVPVDAITNGVHLASWVDPKLREKLGVRGRTIQGADFAGAARMSARDLWEIKAAGKPFLWHSCGCIFSIMDDVIALGIDAKHSNEDVIAPYERWIELYGSRIGLLGGIDVDLLCRKEPAEVFEVVLERGRRYRSMARGYALGSGNSIPDYVPVDGYLALVRAGQALRTSS